MMETNTVQRLLHFLGHKDEKHSCRTKICSIISVIMSFGTIMKIYKNWNINIIKRFTAMKDLDVTLTCLLFSLEIIFVPHNMWSLLKIINKDFYKEETDDNLIIKLSNEKINVIINNKISQIFYLKNTIYLVLLIVIFLICAPVFIFLYTYLVENDQSNYRINLQNFPLPIEFWIPETFNNSPILLITIYSLLSMDLVVLASYACIILGAFSAAVQTIIIDLKLYCISLKEIDEYCEINNFNSLKCNINENYTERRERKLCFDSEFFDSKIYDNKLRLYIKYLIIQHNVICRFIKNVNKFVQLSITAANQCVCFQMCVFLYLAIENLITTENAGSCEKSILGINVTNNTFMSIGFLCSAVFESLLLYAYCIHGQRLIDEYDELRRSLAECSWVDKPQWFKKMLLIMMTRSNAPVCIKPFGIYIINLENFITVLKVTYSSVNLLRSLNRN